MFRSSALLDADAIAGIATATHITQRPALQRMIYRIVLPSQQFCPFIQVAALAEPNIRHKGNQRYTGEVYLGICMVCQAEHSTWARPSHPFGHILYSYLLDNSAFILIKYL